MSIQTTLELTRATDDLRIRSPQGFLRLLFTTRFDGPVVASYWDVYKIEIYIHQEVFSHSIGNIKLPVFKTIEATKMYRSNRLATRNYIVWVEGYGYYWRYLERRRNLWYTFLVSIQCSKFELSLCI